MIKLSIIVLVFNKLNFTLSCLKDLFLLNEDEVEIIIVDNNSSDNTELELRRINRKNFKYIRNEENLFFAKGCAIGYNAATSNNILFLNNDIKVKSNHQNWTDILISAIENNPNSLIGPTGGLVDEKNGFQFVYETNDSNKKINYMSGWCLAAKKDIFNKLIIKDYTGPFSEEFGFYFEDTDLSFRATQQNIQFKIIDLPLTHFGKISSRQLNTYALYSKAREIFIKKWSNK